MKNLMLLEWSKLKWPVLISMIGLTLTVSVLTGTLYKGYSLEHDLEAWEIGIEIIVFLFPLVAVIPVCWLMYFERKDQFLMYTLPRVKKSRYLWSKWIVVASSSFLIMFIAMFIGVITALYFKPEITPVYGLVDTATGNTIPRLELQHFLGSLFVHHPLAYGMLLGLWQGLLSAIIATLGFVISLFVRNIFVILTGPFIYVMLENFILSLLRYESFRIYISFNPEFYNASKYGYWPLLFGPALVLLVSALTLFYFAKIKKVTVYPS
ncbi:hypothetical protein [Paenibacillus solani]|uniref:Uncharacterized protein n=1 Tax=Paenibacillus solani TaxID=1705565 RepID=A0A0M1P6Q7_9BACL|nr:hypothetical protein [Paenibacillus solani]KOR90171.1 hypothetical protein AM231_14190 [Paenibacillus solani]